MFDIIALIVASFEVSLIQWLFASFVVLGMMCLVRKLINYGS